MTTVNPSGNPSRAVQQSASPVNLATVNMSASDRDIDLWLTPAGTLAQATVVFPAGPIGQDFTIGSSQQITLLNFTGATNILKQ